MSIYTLYNTTFSDYLTSQGKVPGNGSLGVDFLSDDVSALITKGTLTVLPARLTASSDLTSVDMTYSGGGTPPATVVTAVTADVTVQNALSAAYREIGRLRADVIRLTNDVVNLNARSVAAGQNN